MKLRQIVAQRWCYGIPIEDKVSICIAIAWIIGIFVIWIPQTIVDILNIRIDPFAFSPKDILMAYLTILAFLPAVTLTAATIAAGSYSY